MDENASQRFSIGGSAADDGVVVAGNPFDDGPPVSFAGGMGNPMSMNGPMPTGYYGCPPQFGRCGPPGGMMPGDHPGLVPHGHHPGGPPHHMAMMGGGGPSPMSAYPGGPPRMFHPGDRGPMYSTQNPNAPPTFFCGRCAKEVHENEQFVQCDGTASGCNMWYHSMCAGLSDDACKLLQLESWAAWVCDKCYKEKEIPLVKFS